MPELDVKREYATSQYHQAVAHARHLLSSASRDSHNVEKVLISCVVFICYEDLVGDYKAAQMHLRADCALFRRSSGGRRSRAISRRT